MSRVTESAPWRTFRRIVRAIGPKWLTREVISTPLDSNTQVEVDNRALYAMAAVKDAAAERVRLGVLARFPIPGQTAQDSLLEIGRSRAVERGPNEPDAAYCERLRRWLDDWRIAGSPWSILEQVRAYCSPSPVRARIFTNRGDCYTIDRDGTRSRARDTAWDWDGDASRWARWWLVIYPTTAGEPWGRQIAYDDGPNWGAVPGTWGSTAQPEDVFALQRIIRARKPRGGRCAHIIVCFDDDHFDPSDPSTLPDGTWGSTHKLSGGSYVPARFDDAAYWPGA